MIRRLSEYGFFRAGGVLVGTHAFLSYGNLLGAHCTGLEAVYRIRKIARLDRATAVVGAVGSSFTLGRGLDPRRVAR